MQELRSIFSLQLLSFSLASLPSLQCKLCILEKWFVNWRLLKDALHRALHRALCLASENGNFDFRTIFDRTSTFFNYSTRAKVAFQRSNNLHRASSGSRLTVRLSNGKRSPMVMRHSEPLKALRVDSNGFQWTFGEGTSPILARSIYR